MDEKFDRIEKKIDRLDERLDTMSNTLSRLTSTVEVHEQRSTNLEKLVGVVQAEVKPLEKHVHAVEGVLKFLGASTVIIAIIAFIKKLLL